MSDDISVERARAFLQELTALTEKHGIVIGGCGCCGSPWLDTFRDSEYAPKRGGRYGVDRRDAMLRDMGWVDPEAEDDGGH